MTSGRLFNNFGIEALGIAFVLNHSTQLPISKLLLISPITAHHKLLAHLARKSTKILSFEKYLIEHASDFTNFNRRYYDSLVNSINAIQLLNELEIVKIIESKISLRHSLEYQRTMGSRAEKISKAAPNISALLEETPENLHLNLRIEL
jgi:hypothetical protein